MAKNHTKSLASKHLYQIEDCCPKMAVSPPNPETYQEHAMTTRYFAQPLTIELGRSTGALLKNRRRKEQEG